MRSLSLIPGMNSFGYLHDNFMARYIPSHGIFHWGVNFASMPPSMAISYMTGMYQPETVGLSSLYRNPNK